MGATSSTDGHEIVFENGKWIYADTKEIFSENFPETWKGRCSGDGNKTYIDQNGDRRYVVDDVKIGNVFRRPCSKCGKYPNEEGDDFCLQHLGNVMNACCGHGAHEGYVQFDNGITIRGFFRIEKD